MEVLRVFNNNVVLAKDTSGEVIVTGRGLGFKARPGDPVDPAKVVRVFVPSDGRDPDHMAELLAGIPIEHITLMTSAMAEAGLSTAASQSPTLLMALADHIGLAIARTQSGQTIEYPLLGEVRNLYYAEYQQALDMVRYVNSQLDDVELPDSEAVALTLHLVNAGFSSGDLSYTYTMTGILQQMLNVIEQTYDITLDQSTVSVGRFITHLRYLFVRIHQHKQLNNEHSAIGKAIRESDLTAYRCAQQLATIAELRLGAELTDDEISYLALHVARMTSVEQRTPQPNS